MLEEIKVIAERIKGLREISGISPETVAKDLGLSTEQYLEYESGKVDIPAGFLIKVAQKNSMELSALLSGENPRLHVYCVVRKDKGLNVERRKQYKYENLAYNLLIKKRTRLLSELNHALIVPPWNLIRTRGRSLTMLLKGL